MEDHVGRMLKEYRSEMSPVGVAVKRAYASYVEELMRLSGKGEGYGVSGLDKIVKCDPVELVIALHDVGKCTQRYQESLREKCTAPNHEVVSAAYLYTLSLSIDKQWGPLTTIPHMLSILLHHHSMRSLKEVLGRITFIEISEDDEKHVNECALIALEALRGTCPGLVNSVPKSRLPRSLQYGVNMLKHVVGLVDRVEEIAVPAYGVAVRITGVLSILDRYSASINRSCGRLTEEDLERDVAEYLKRRRAISEARKILESLGI
jgi:CRISPR-associated endonuclease Cas3-HD